MISIGLMAIVTENRKSMKKQWIHFSDCGFLAAANFSQRGELYPAGFEG
jgi:hypothetical protein